MFVFVFFRDRCGDVVVLDVVCYRLCVIGVRFIGLVVCLLVLLVVRVVCLIVCSC